MMFSFIQGRKNGPAVLATLDAYTAVPKCDLITTHPNPYPCFTLQETQEIIFYFLTNVDRITCAVHSHWLNIIMQTFYLKILFYSICYQSTEYCDSAFHMAGCGFEVVWVSGPVMFLVAEKPSTCFFRSNFVHFMHRKYRLDTFWFSAHISAPSPPPKMYQGSHLVSGQIRETRLFESTVVLFLLLNT